MQLVKQKITWIWQNAERILIVVFFATFTLNIRKVFLTPHSFLKGGFSEYATMSVSWTDILMVAVILIYTIKLIFSQLSRLVSIKLSLNNVIQELSSVIRNYYDHNVSRETFYLVLFLIWAGLSIFWSQFRPITTYRLLILLEIAIFAYISVKSLNTAKWLNFAYYAFITAGLSQAMLGITQFIHNGSLGLHFLGESIIGPNIDGVAKIIIDGEKHIRAYGTMPHPNILAGFLIIPLFLLTGEIIGRYASRETFLSKIPAWLLWIFLLIIGSSFILTFSRSAFLGLFVGLIIYAAWLLYSWHAINTLKNNSKYLILIILAIAFVAIVLLQRTSFFSSQSLEERTLYQIVSYETILNHPIHGVGVGQFVINAYYAHSNLENWQYQPVHNIYLLIFSELGIVGFSIFLLFINFLLSRLLGDKTSKIGYTLTYHLFCCIVISFLVLSFFDHYFWDIKIGTIIFTLPILFLYTLNQNLNKFDKKQSHLL